MPRFLIALFGLMLFAGAAAACPMSGHQMPLPDDTAEDSDALTT